MTFPALTKSEAVNMKSHLFCYFLPPLNISAFKHMENFSEMSEPDKIQWDLLANQNWKPQA